MTIDNGGYVKSPMWGQLYVSRQYYPSKDSIEYTIYVPWPVDRYRFYRRDDLNSDAWDEKQVDFSSYLLGGKSFRHDFWLNMRDVENSLEQVEENHILRLVEEDILRALENDEIHGYHVEKIGEEEYLGELTTASEEELREALHKAGIEKSILYKQFTESVRRNYMIGVLGEQRFGWEQ